MTVSQKMDRDNEVEIAYTDEQLEMDRVARAFPWDKRQVPKTYLRGSTIEQRFYNRIVS
jgi:hypothetical protein